MKLFGCRSNLDENTNTPGHLVPEAHIIFMGNTTTDSILNNNLSFEIL